MKTHYLLVDLGTGNTRVALACSDGTILGLRTVSNTYYRDDAYGDAQYFLPEEWQKQILRCCRELHREFPDIRPAAMSSAGARQSIVLLDRAGHPFYGLPNIDNRGREYMDAIQDRDTVYRLSGKWVTEDFCAAKLLGFRMRYPDLYEKVGTVLSISEWIAQIFTGVSAMEPSQACETQLYDLENGEWSRHLCDDYGVGRELLPPLLPAGAVIAPILPEFRRELNMAENAVFIMGGADTQVALKQTALTTGDIAVVSGTTSPVVTVTKEKYYDPLQRVWTDANLGGGDFLVEMNPGVTGLNYQRIKASLGSDLSYGALEAAYAKKTDFQCTASFSSLLFYRQQSLRKGGFFTRSPMAAELDRIDMMWAVLGDIACSIYEQLSHLTGLVGNDRDYVLGCGGGFQSGTLCQMLADLSGRQLRLAPGFEQATVQGLISICNETLGLPGGSSGGEKICFLPRKEQLIHAYYPLWLENRNRANQIVP